MNSFPDPKTALGPVCYTGAPVRVILLGDNSADAKYIRQARQVLGELVNGMVLGQYVYGKSKKILTDGTVIVTHRNNGLDTIIIDTTAVITTTDEQVKSKIFLESGYVDLRPLFANGGVYGPKPPGKLYYSDLLLTAYHKAEKPDGKTKSLVVLKTPDADPWLDWLYSLTNKSNDITKLEYIVNPYEAGRDSIAIPADALSKRSVYHYAEPTATTGKLKLYIQCLLGGENNKFANQSTVQLLATPGTYYGTWGLYTAPSGVYFLVRLYPDRIRFYPLKTTVIGKGLQKIVQKLGDTISFTDKTKIEAYILSQTKFTPPDESSLTGELADYITRYYITDTAIVDDPIIKTLAYGWKSNWAGDEWSIVTRQPVPDGLGFKWQMMRRYKLRIEEVIDTETNTRLLNPYLTLEEEVAWTPRVATDIVWYPIRIPLGPEDMLWTQWQPSASLSYPLLSTDAPVYCWYDAKDNLVLIRYKRVTQTNYSFDSGQVTLVNNLYTCDASDAESMYTWTRDEATAGFYVDILEKADSDVQLFKYSLEPNFEDFISPEFEEKKEYLSSIETYNRTVHEWTCVSYGGGFGLIAYCNSDGSWAQGPKWISNNQGYYGPPPIDPCVYDIYSQTRYTQEEYGSCITYTANKVDWTWNRTSVLVLPMFSSESAYIALKYETACTLNKFTYYYTTPFVLYATTFGGGDGYQRLTVNNVYMGPVPNQVRSTTGIEKRTLYRVGLFTKYDVKLLYEMDEVGTDYIPAAKFGHVFEISYSNPLLGNHIGVYGGISGDYYYNGDDRPSTIDWELCTSEKLPSPSDMQGLPIGWF